VKVYLAGSWHDRPRLRQYRADLLESGIAVTSSWLDSADDLPADEAADRCLADIDASHALVVLTDVPSSSGGYHVELGYAIGSGIPIHAVGPKLNLFHHHFLITWHPTWLDALVALTRDRRRAA